MAKVQYPNPKFFRAKDDIDWKKQGENLKEVLGIFGDMLKETDWQNFGLGYCTFAIITYPPLCGYV